MTVGADLQSWSAPVEGATLRRRVALAWALLRVPLLALSVYALRHPILNLVERWFDIYTITRFTIDVLSTPVMRFVSGATLLAGLILVALSVRRLHPIRAYAVSLAVSSALIAGFVVLTGTSLRRGLLVVLLLSTNLAPIELLRARFLRARNLFAATAVGVAEVFCFREYWRWLRSHAGSRPDLSAVRSSLGSNGPGILLASTAMAILVNGGKLLPLEQSLRMSTDAQIIERGRSFNGLEVDPAGRYLYATGHEVPHLRRYRLNDTSAAPLASDLSTGGAQGLAYDPAANEVYAYNTVTRQLQVFDAVTLAIERTIALPQLSPGDPWVAVDPVSNTLTVVSEADERTGIPFIVLDRASGRVIAREDLDAGNVLKHPSKPRLYLSFFRRRSQVLLYDLQQRRIVHEAPADARAERLIFWAAAGEVLVTSPMESRILRFDADDLRSKGHIPAPFGARAIAIDERRQLLLCGNLSTGHLVVIDPNTGTRLRRYYLGPWLRTIVLDVESGTAFVSANGALYRVSYAPPISAHQ